MGESSDTDLGDQEESALLLKCWRWQFDFLSENLDNKFNKLLLKYVDSKTVLRV